MNASFPIMKKLDKHRTKLIKAITRTKRRRNKDFFGRKSQCTRSTEYRIYGKYHRENRPALRKYWAKDGYEEIWFYNNQYHRVDGPAITSNHERHGGFFEAWYWHGQLHREGGPALISHEPESGGYREVWSMYGVLHRIGGPAMILNHPLIGGSKEWWVWGTLHRTNGPAYIHGSLEIWYIDGKPSSIGFLRDVSFTIRNASTNDIKRQRDWIMFRIRTAKLLKKQSLQIRAPLCEEILRELDTQYFIVEPRFYGFDTRFLNYDFKKITLRFDWDPKNYNLTVI